MGDSWLGNRSHSDGLCNSEKIMLDKACQKNTVEGIESELHTQLTDTQKSALASSNALRSKADAEAVIFDRPNNAVKPLEEALKIDEQAFGKDSMIVNQLTEDQQPRSWRDKVFDSPNPEATEVRGFNTEGKLRVQPTYEAHNATIGPQGADNAGTEARPMLINTPRTIYPISTDSNDNAIAVPERFRKSHGGYKWVEARSLDAANLDTFSSHGAKLYKSLEMPEHKDLFTNRAEKGQIRNIKEVDGKVTAFTLPNGERWTQEYSTAWTCKNKEFDGFLGFKDFGTIKKTASGLTADGQGSLYLEPLVHSTFGDDLRKDSAMVKAALLREMQYNVDIYSRYNSPDGDGNRDGRLTKAELIEHRDIQRDMYHDGGNKQLALSTTLKNFDKFSSNATDITIGDYEKLVAGFKDQLTLDLLNSGKLTKERRDWLETEYRREIEGNDKTVNEFQSKFNKQLGVIGSPYRVSIGKIEPIKHHYEHNCQELERQRTLVIKDKSGRKIDSVTYEFH